MCLACINRQEVAECGVSVMHLDEGVEPVAQTTLVLSRGHAVEQLEELFLLLGGSRKHVLCLCMLSSAFGRAERTGWVGGGVTSTRVTPRPVRMSEEAVGGAC